MTPLPSILLLVVLVAISAAGNPVPADLAAATNKNTLVLLHVLFRHGNRTPDKGSVFPNDVYLKQNFTYTPYGFGQLTTKGKQTEYAIGQYIRNTYGNLIPKQYTPDVVSSLATNFKRTKMSLELVLASLFPPQDTEKISPSLDWQPLPFNIEQAQGIIGNAPEYCTQYISEYYNYVLSDAAQSIIAGYKSLYQQLETYSGAEINTPQAASGIYFTLKSEEDFGLALPEWSKNLYPAILEDAASVNYEFSTATPQLTRLSAGFLLKKILSDSFAKRANTLPAERKVFFYSAHEYNVATLLRALNVFYRHVPPFGATIYVELHNVLGIYGIKLYYQDYKAADKEPRLLTIPGCLSFCPLDVLQELVQNNLPGDSDVCFITGEVA